MGHNPVDVTSVVQCVIILKTVLIFPFMHVSSFSQINGTVASLFNENKSITWICPPKKTAQLKCLHKVVCCALHMKKPKLSNNP